jgi:para-aminobenzoate synthetase component 1
MSGGPVAAAAQLAGRRGRVLLHSARDDDGLGRWSFVTAEPRATLIANGHSIVELDASGRPARRFTADPFDAAEEFIAEHAAGEPTSEPEPRVIGYLGYDLARVVERLPGGPMTGKDTPDLWLSAYDAVARWAPDDAAPVILGRDAAARDRLAAAIATAHPLGLPPRLGPLVADAPALHLARVERIRDYITAGDCYQVNLARRLVARVTMPGDAVALYAALAAAAPAPYGAVIEADGLTLISGSPERFLASRGDGRIETRPIKGTRARTPGGDSASERAELVGSPKDAAEHLMIVDLERNDLGRVAETGSVKVDALAYPVELPALHHLVSRVSAQPRADVGLAQLLRATFPGGSITGAPKVRAMQIIDELEPTRRGPYCGALGYFGAGGRFDLAIGIRIGVLARDELRVHVGGGIVADSDPLAELAETEIKAAGWRAALASLEP